MNKEVKVNYYSVVPAEVKYNNKLTQRAKLIYGEISSLSNKTGYCFATNNYFAKLYRCTNRIIQNALISMSEENIEKVKIVKIQVFSGLANERNYVDNGKTLHFT